MPATQKGGADEIAGAASSAWDYLCAGTVSS
jgi:hypothetical protein